ncbi:MAG: hypothetical protein F6K41_15835 [Symploca sp. SIO3E6]|nr:hypothetical protein [Caldora sp. SIO3E6]
MPEVKEETTTSPIIPDVGAKHLGDNSPIKPKVYNPNALPSASWEQGRKFSAEQCTPSATHR